MWGPPDSLCPSLRGGPPLAAAPPLQPSAKGEVISQEPLLPFTVRKGRNRKFEFENSFLMVSRTDSVSCSFKGQKKKFKVKEEVNVFR